jgi:hypothetical protein
MVTEIEQGGQAYQGMNLYLWILIILIAILSIVGMLFYKISMGLYKLILEYSLILK